jgi:CDP-diacylglycerol--serine O-phosphatidyltransferase
VTSGNLAAGFVALVLAQQGEYVWAAGLVGVAALCDAVDGVVARLTWSNCEVGSQLDSLADLVSFGVAPAFIIYLSTLHSLPVAGIGACLGFVLCGAWRLARFQTEAESRIRFIGLPIPPAGVITVVLALLDPMPGLPLVVVAVLSLLMVSRVPFPTFSELRQVAFPPKRPHAAEPVQGNRE